MDKTSLKIEITAATKSTSSLGLNGKLKGILPNISEEVLAGYLGISSFTHLKCTFNSESLSVCFCNIPVITPSALFTISRLPKASCERSTGRDSNLFFAFPVN